MINKKPAKPRAKKPAARKSTATTAKKGRGKKSIEKAASQEEGEDLRESQLCK